MEINSENWKLIWSDEFSGTELDRTKWRFDIGNNNGWGNNELQYYTEGKNIFFENGMLVIEARREEIKSGGRTYNYTSTRIKTENLFEVQYGKIEARIKVPQGKGLWPAFWMLGSIRYVGWPLCGEIDIMEFLGHDKWTIYGTVHGPKYSASQGISRAFRLDPTKDKPFTQEFYVFGILWNENEIVWYVNDKIYHRVTKDSLEKQGKVWVFNQPFFIILNLAVGGNWPGYPDFDTPFPARMYIDYVRAYEYQENN
ncbi:MAG: family 16 glycosylhydrolase [Fervidobacterium sp.]